MTAPIPGPRPRPTPLIVGINYFPGNDDLIRRQAAAVAALRTLQRVHPVNVQFYDEVQSVEGLRELAVLRNDSRLVSGRAGPRKPIVTEVFDRLADEADRVSAEWFLLINSDIILTQAAVDLVLDGGYEALVFARTDFDTPGRANPELLIYGQDAFAVRVDWWRRNRGRFREYILGDYVFDNVYTAQLLCHARAVLVDGGHYLWHERHPTTTASTSPFGRYAQFLAALDTPYFSLWAQYAHRVQNDPTATEGAVGHTALQREVFHHQPGVGARLVQSLRSLKAVVRYHWYRRRG